MPVRILDGGFSTQLSRHVRERLDASPLWTSYFLVAQPDAVLQTHLDYLRAGADIISTNSYQASVEGFQKHLDISRRDAIQTIKVSVDLAKRARHLFYDDTTPCKPILIAGSVGPYGACLNDGSEYHGVYASQITLQTLIHWHRPRMQALVEAGVDILALETIPALREAEAVLTVLREFPQMKAWLSFQCKDGEHLASGEKFADAVLKCCELNREQIVAVGCNCVQPLHVSSLISQIPSGTPIIVYPNSGEFYSTDKGWSGEKTFHSFVEEWLTLGTKYIGGCCRTDAEDIAQLREVVLKQKTDK